MTATILITGGTGLVGKRLTELLMAKGYTVTLLSRTASEGPIKKYKWDIPSMIIDEKSIQQADHIIHLAGAGVFDKKWTTDYKKEIWDSRVNSTNLLIQTLSKTTHSVKSVVSASAVGIYGFDTKDILVTEDAPKGDGFLAEVTEAWENAMLPLEKLSIRSVCLRVGIVLSSSGGALKELAAPIKMYAGAPLGKGTQYMSWIHIDDLCNMFIQAIENGTQKGAFNAVAPIPETNATITKEIAKALKKPLWLPNVPSFVLKWIVGSERSQILLGGNKVSSKKIEASGFKFKFPTLKEALEDLLKNNK